MEHNRSTWGSNLGFLMAAIGSAVGLGNIQFVKDGDRLSGRASADADFDALEDDEDVLGGDAGEELPDYLR